MASPDPNGIISSGRRFSPARHQVSDLVDQLIASKCIRYGQYQTLSRLVLADGTVDEEERDQINRLFDAIQSGLVKIIE